MRVGVLAKPMLLTWQRRALRNVAAVDGATIEHVVIDASLRDESSLLSTGAGVINEGAAVSVDDVRLFVRTLREDGLKSLLYADEKLGWLAFGETSKLENLRSRPIESADCLAGATFHDCMPVPADGSWNTLPDDVTRTLGRECDVVLRFGFGLLKGPILDAPKYGVLGAHGSDIRRYRGMGPRVTFLADEEVASVTLQQLTEDIDGGRIVTIATEPLPASPTLDDVYAAVYDLLTDVFADGIRRLQRSDFSFDEPGELGEYYPHRLMKRNPAFVARILMKNNLRRIRAVGVNGSDPRD